MSARPAPPRIFDPPPVRGKLALDKIDRGAFQRSVPILAAKIPAAESTKFMRAPEMRSAILNAAKVRVVEPVEAEPDRRLLLLQADTEAEIPSEALTFLRENGASIVPFAVQLDYTYWNAEEILKAILPEEALDGLPTSFAQTGHLAHFNLRQAYLPYKHLIGQVVLDKNPRLRTVVNKLDTIDTEFRFFAMEVLAGEPDFVVTTTESNCKFTFDFSKVYWNSRLSTEHTRLVDAFQPGEVIADVMAGVGPFAVPAGKKGCLVLANDLNPESYRWMKENIEANKVQDAVRPFNIDGREFIRTALSEIKSHPFPPLPPRVTQKERRELRRQRDAGAPSPSPTSSPAAPAPPRRRIDHYVMNLPGSALEFLDAFRDAYAPGSEAEDGEPRPMVHVHCFSRELEPEKMEKDVCERATTYLGAPVTPDMDGFNLHLVRSVAPNKNMACLSFRLPEFSA